MANTTRKVTGMVLVAAAIATHSQPVCGSDMPAASHTSLSHVRSDSAAIVRLVELGTEQSATFRHLVETIDAQDVFVYVQEGICGYGIRACFYAVSSSTSFRMLWVHVDTRKGADWTLMGSIGHELRHAVEVLDEPSVTTSAAMFFLYQRIGYRGQTNGLRETMAAVDAGNTIREEVRAFNRRAVAP